MKLIYLKESKLCWRILFILVSPLYFLAFAFCLPKLVGGFRHAGYYCRSNRRRFDHLSIGHCHSAGIILVS
jgi:hypothetical protein